MKCCDNKMHLDTKNQTRCNCTLLTWYNVNVFNPLYEFTVVNSVQLAGLIFSV
jgi:hypothetical protein